MMIRYRPSPSHLTASRFPSRLSRSRASPSNGRITGSKVGSDRGDDARYPRVHPPLPNACVATGFHRIRYYGLLISPTRANNIARIRELLAVPLIPIDAIKAVTTKPEQPKAPEHPCPCCGSCMRIIEIFFAGQQPKHRPTSLPPKIRIDTS
jgi:hypothetical protein